MIALTKASDPIFAGALDLFDVPDADGDFVDRIVARAMRPRVVSAIWVPRRSAAARRGPWARRTLAGMLAIGLASATAAATGVFGPIANPLPAVAQILSPTPAKVASVKPAKRRPVAAKPARPTPTATPSPVATVPVARAGFARLEKLPPPMARAIFARTVTRIQRRLWERGYAVSRPVIRARLLARIGDPDKPLPIAFERALARHEAAIAAGWAPRPRLDNVARPGIANPPEAPAGADAAALAPPVNGIAIDQQRRFELWRERQAHRRYWRALRWQRMHGSDPSMPSPPAPSTEPPSPPAGDPPPQ